MNGPMNSPFFVEVLASKDEVRHRHQVSALPIRIGRAYDNDFILDDPHTAAHHAIVEQGEDGSLHMRDLGSHNGIVHQGKRLPLISINGNTVVRLGHTNLRVRAADFQVADELADTTIHGWEGWPPALSGLAIIALLAALSTWLGDVSKFEAIRYLMAITYVLSGALVWSAVWAFANRLFGGHARFGRHLFITGCGMAAMEVWSLFSGTAAYALSLEELSRYGSHVMIAITAAMVYFHLGTINPRHPRRVAVTAIILGLLGSGLMLMMNFQRYGQAGDELYMSQILPPAIRLSADKPVDQFINEAKSLKDKVDADRTKTVSHDDQDADAPE
ncbi:FHA domain-containing protein [Undibacterium sp. TJN25]|uniref:FHA domain-containing protein n=1 Tax=Undibacterium sp. TJN25 TaxID=3413056 RepID=UPI003BF00BB2